MSYDFVIRVIYPLQDGRIVLRTDADWNKDVEAVSVSDDRTTYEFHVRRRDPFFYFKPCAIDDSGFHWSVGRNYLAALDALSGKDIYPFFLSSPNGDITPKLEVHSELADGPHLIRVYVPPGYQENELKRYPVLYMHDGTNLFFPDESFLGIEWGIDETLDLMDSMSVIDKVIVVGIYANDRMNEYTQAGYDAYGQFIVQDLRGWIDANFRTLTGPSNTAVMGSSLGGVASLYLGWQFPEVFGMSGCMSSTFGYKDDLFKRVADEPLRTSRFYLDSGWPDDNYEATRSMRDLMLRRGYVSGRDVLYLVYPNDRHNESFWAARVHIPFQFFFEKVPRFPSG